MIRSRSFRSLQVIHDLYSYVDARTGRSASLIRSHLSRLQRTNHLNILSARRLTASSCPMPNVLTQQLCTLATTDSTTLVSKHWKGHTFCESKASSWSARRSHTSKQIPNIFTHLNILQHLLMRVAVGIHKVQYSPSKL
jgi:hypothetical protein